MKRGFLFLFILTFAFVSMACGNFNKNGAANGKAFFEGKDDGGIRLVLKEKPKRIVCTSVGLDETLIDLVDEDKIQAMSWYSHDELMTCIAPRAKKHKHLQKNVEAILKCNPDLVIVSNDSTQPVEFVQGLRDLGLPVYLLKNPNTIEEIISRISRMGKLVGEEENAEKIINEVNACLKRVDEKVKKLSPDDKKVIMAFGYSGPFGRKDGLFDVLCRRAGLINGAALLNIPKNVPISKEQVLIIDPEIIFLPTWESERNQAKEFREMLLSDYAYRNVKAIKEKNLIAIPDKYRYSVSQYAVFGIEIMARAVYPELFQ